MNPSGQREANRYSRHDSSVPKRRWNSKIVSGKSGRDTPRGYETDRMELTRYALLVLTAALGVEHLVVGIQVDIDLLAALEHREVRFRLRRMQPIGCRDRGPSPVLHGSRSRKQVALTFDDGPSAYTPKILDVLRRKHALGTFFDVGAAIPGEENLLRSILRGGHELANHSLAHELMPSRASMAVTTARIEEASGFRPCLFRPPYGAYDSRVVDDASSLDMTTVNWDVDPQDWTTPGSEAIYQRVVSKTRPGSIVLMHDGGGNRSQTVAALPRIIKKLRHRGYRFTTVSRLLGQRVTWGPVHRSDRRGLRSAATRLDPRLEALTPPSETENARRWRRVSQGR